MTTRLTCKRNAAEAEEAKEQCLAPLPFSALSATEAGLIVSGLTVFRSPHDLLSIFSSCRVFSFKCIWCRSLFVFRRIAGSTGALSVIHTNECIMNQSRSAYLRPRSMLQSPSLYTICDLLPYSQICDEIFHMNFTRLCSPSSPPCARSLAKACATPPTAASGAPSRTIPACSSACLP